MNNCAVIVDNRLSDSELTNTVKRHLAFLPDWDSKHIRAPNIRSGPDYNNLLTSAAFWQELQNFDRVLIFQHDSALLRLGIEDFLEFDYVGAPWLAGAPWARKDRAGGNGGLSLRNPKKALNLICEFPYSQGYGNEDVYFSKYLDRVEGLVAPYGVCSKFSCETEFKLGTLGYHAIQKHLTPPQVEQIVNQYKDGRQQVQSP